jgi:hypothetical protein
MTGQARPLRIPPLFVRIKIGATDPADRISKETGLSDPIDFPLGASPQLRQRQARPARTFVALRGCEWFATPTTRFLLASLLVARTVVVLQQGRR